MVTKNMAENKKEFNLSKKIKFDETGNIGLFVEKDVKKFIRLLKEEISLIFYNCKDECGATDFIIDKLAGKSLI